MITLITLTARDNYYLPPHLVARGAKNRPYFLQFCIGWKMNANMLITECLWNVCIHYVFYIVLYRCEAAIINHLSLHTVHSVITKEANGGEMG